MYTSIPINEVLPILKNNLVNSNKMNMNAIEELLALTETILKQNYFAFNQTFYHQKDGLAMGSPLSGILAELYLNEYENKHIFDNNPYHKNIIFYSRYVDDTFLIYKGTCRQIDNFRIFLNNINSHIQFTHEIETNESINYLDLTIKKQDNCLKYSIYRKLTTTDTTIAADSHHPWVQKMSAYNYYVNRMLTVPMDDADYQRELNIVKYIAHSNGYPNNMVDKLVRKLKRKLRNPLVIKNKENDNPKPKYVSAVYTNIMPRIIQNILHKNNIKVSFKTNNKLLDLIRTKRNTQLTEKTGIYKITCSDCECFYVGQTGRGFKKRYVEHLPKRNSVGTSCFARHLVNEGHSYKDFESNLEPLHLCRKGKYMNTLEEYEIYRAYHDTETRKYLLNEQLQFRANPLYETAIQMVGK